MKSCWIFRRVALCHLVYLLVFGHSWAASGTGIQPAGLRNTGQKFVRHYDRKEYGGEPQNWSIFQDKTTGIIYIANHGGLLQYDGISWRFIPMPNASVFSVAMDEAGIFYAGGKNEFGRFIPDEHGRLIYESLSERLKKNDPDSLATMGDVWGIDILEDGIYFRTPKFIFRWDAQKEKIHRFFQGPGLLYSAVWQGKLLIDWWKSGLMQIANGSLIPFPGGEYFAHKTGRLAVPYDDGTGTILIGTRVNGLFLLNGSSVTPFRTAVDDYLKEKELWHGIRLSISSAGEQQGGFALATARGGLVIIDKHGSLKYRYDKEGGLPDNNVYHVFEDLEGNLWLALDNGISKIEYNSPLSIYDKRTGLSGLVLSVMNHHEDLYAGTTEGLFLLSSSGPSPGGKFRPVPGIPGYCSSLLSLEDSLLAATRDGVFLVKPRHREQITDDMSYMLAPSQRDPRRVWVGTFNGLTSLYLTPGDQTGRWVGEPPFESSNKEMPDIRTIVEENGYLWLASPAVGVFKISLSASGKPLRPDITFYPKSRFFPGDIGEINIYRAAGHVVFATTNHGIFRFDGEKERFFPDSTLGEEFSGSERAKGVFRMVQDDQHHIWFHSESRNFQAIPHMNRVELRKNPFLRVPLIQVNAIYPGPRGNFVWFAAHDVLFCWDKTFKKDYCRNFSTLIRKVTANGVTVYNGDAAKRDTGLKSTCPAFPYPERNLRFEFAAPFFEDEASTRYRCKLTGYETGWSDWTAEPKKDYTNLDAGIYTFYVQARNIYHHPGTTARFKFRILPPWTRTWWAFLGYGLVLFLAMFLVVKWRSGKLEREKQKLERIVKERTSEINEKNQQLERQTLQLKEQSEKLHEMDKVKSRFFANISHEFRTPLTLIMGPLEQMLSDCRSEKKEKQLHLMLRNSQRLLGLINQLLELSKFESGKMKLQASRQNIIPFLKGLVESFEPVASKNERELIFQVEAEEISLYFDSEKLEEVIFNLLANAIKFTPAGGKITLQVSRTAASGEHGSAPGLLDIAISDTGPGIPRDQLAHIFDRFYQSDSTFEHHQKGSGIGLAIAKELVELHHGKIDVHSSEGKGTEFIIRLPLGETHLKAEEIAESAETHHQSGHLREIPALDKNEAIARAGPHQPLPEKYDPLKPGKNIILVVEDNEDVRDYIRGALTPLYRVEEAANGQEGLSKAQEIVPDLIISDIMMPGRDGYELCRELKHHILTSHIPIILLTAKASEECIIKGLETGADDYITKPFSTKILSARIKNLIDLRTHMQQTLKREMTRQPVQISVSLGDKAFIKKLKKIIEDNLSNVDFNVAQMCKELDMSQPTLYRKIVALSGESPTEFIRNYRLQRGAELLRNNWGTVLEVALEVGFSSANYFSKCFKKMFHQLPSTYQASETQ